jgi:hypothetical protein
MSKRGDVTSDKTVTYILIGLALAVIIGVIISLNPNVLYKFFPDYSNTQEGTDQVISDSDLLAMTCGADEIIVGKMEGGKIIVKSDLKSDVFEKTNIDYQPEKDYNGIYASLKADADSDVSVNSEWTAFWVGYIKTDMSVLINFTIANQRLLLPENKLEYSMQQLVILDGSRYNAGLFCGKKTKDYQKAVISVLWGNENKIDMSILSTEDSYQSQGYSKIDLNKYLIIPVGGSSIGSTGTISDRTYRGMYIKKVEAVTGVYAFFDSLEGNIIPQLIGEIDAEDRMFFYCNIDGTSYFSTFFAQKQILYKNGFALRIPSKTISTYNPPSYTAGPKTFRCDTNIFIDRMELTTAPGSSTNLIVIK